MPRATNPPNVLLIAYSCEPGRGSEWGISWATLSEMARHNPTFAIVHEDNRPALEAHLATHESPYPIAVRYVRAARGFGWLRRRDYNLQNLHYYLWQLAAARVAKRWHEHARFDVVQHVSWSRWWMPSAGAALAKRGVRFIFGPCVGGESVPRAFRRSVGWKAYWAETKRGVARFFWTKDPLLAKCVRNADLLVAGTPTALNGFQKLGGRDIRVMPVATISDVKKLDDARPVRAAYRRDQTFRLCGVGGLSPYRGVDLVLRAIAASGLTNVHYTHGCGGPRLATLQRLAWELGIADRVTFLGETPHGENLKQVAQSDLLIHLVLRDSQGVTPEALALGVPVLTLDHHSMSAIIDDSVGHKIGMSHAATPASIVHAAAEKLKEWAADRDALVAMEDACVARSRELNPQHRVAIFRRWHEELLSREAGATTPKIAISA